MGRRGSASHSGTKKYREMVAEQCPAQFTALTASTHLQLYKNDARLLTACYQGFGMIFLFRLCNL